MQFEVYGRELDNDEVWSLLVGLNEWYTVDFLLRCMIERRTEAGRFGGAFASNADDVEWEYPQSTEKARRRFPNAELVKDSSGVYFLVKTFGPGYTPFGWHRMMLGNRRVSSVYHDAVAGSYVVTLAYVDFETCEPSDIERINYGDGLLGTGINFEIIRTSYIRSLENHTPLQPHEVGQPVEITPR